MSLSSLLEILRSKSKIISDENSAIINLTIIFQDKYRIVFDYNDITLIENIQQNEVLKCVVFDKICLFAIVVLCYHVICGCCYVRHFNLINYLQFNSYYTKCHSCMEMIKCSDAITISQ